MEENRLRPPLTRDALKYIAVIAMLLDHVAWYLMAFASPLAQAFHTLGRITAPIMCAFLAQGYRYTRSVEKYALRLFVFSLASQIPWMYLHRAGGKLSFNMLFTLLLCLLMLHCDTTVQSPLLRFFGMAACFAATGPCDWKYFAPLWCLIFFHFGERKHLRDLLFSLVALAYFAYQVYARVAVGYTLAAGVKNSLFTLGAFLTLPLLYLCNNEKGKWRGSKWFFYVFYPLHLGVIAGIVAWKK